MSTKDAEIRPPINSESMSDSLLHFIYIFSRTNVYGYATADKLYKLNIPKYGSRGNFSSALSRILKMGLVSLNVLDGKEKYYLITPEGIDCIYQLAMLRRKKHTLLYAKQAYRCKDPSLPGATYDTHFENQYF